MNKIEFLDLEDLLLLSRSLDVGPVRDLGILDAACARPRTSLLGADAYPSLAEKAAALLHSIVRGHPLVDGNTQLGWLSTVVFLMINGSEVILGDDEAFNLVMSVAEGAADISDIADTLDNAIR